MVPQLAAVADPCHDDDSLGHDGGAGIVPNFLRHSYLAMALK